VLACEAEGASIDEIWNDEARERVRSGLLATKAGYAGTTVEKLLPYLDAQADSWREHEITACRNARVEQTWDADTFDRASWCLDERRGELASLIGEFERADTGVLQKAISAAAGLTPISPCLDVDTLMRLPAPPQGEARQAVTEVRDELVAARMLQASGKYREGLVVVVAARERAQALDWPPLSAAALQVEARLLEESGEFEAAESTGVAAYMEAASAGAWDVAADAATRLAWDIGIRQARDREGRIWTDHAKVAIDYAGDVLGVREANRLTTLGIILELAAKYDDAKVLHEQALSLLERALGPEHPDLAPCFNNLANVLYAKQDFEGAKQQYGRALALRERALGPEHPDVGKSVNNLANVHATNQEFEAARALYDRARNIFEQALGPDHPDVATSLNNLAYVDKALGAYDRAEQQYQRVLTILEHKLDPDHPDIAVGLTNLALVEVELARPEQALGHLERAIVIYDAQEAAQNNELPARFALAKLVVDTDRPRAIAQATAAAEGYRAVGRSRQAQLAEVEGWLAKTGGRQSDALPDP
jgi:tetratricopeptide (TPR) repeat protein